MPGHTIIAQSSRKASKAAREAKMLTIKGSDRAAIIIAAISIATPILLPYPGTALQRTYTKRTDQARYSQ